MKKKNWTIGFLSVTALAIFLELFAIFDNSDETIPWTILIRDNIPSYISLPIITGFALWLVHHFYKAYRKKPKHTHTAQP